MRTRRSPRNQEILFRALFMPPEESPIQGPRCPRCWDCLEYPKGGRSRGECLAHGEVVNGITTRPGCFRPRKVTP